MFQYEQESRVLPRRIEEARVGRPPRRGGIDWEGGGEEEAPPIAIREQGRRCGPERSTYIVISG